jgi:Flp pilus assembly protein TadG
MVTVHARRLGRAAAGLPGLLWRRHRAGPGDRGAMAVIIALLLPVIAGIAGLSIDVGSWYLTRAQLQNAADAAALAGAAQLPGSPTTAAADAKTLAGKNVSGATVTTVTPYNSDSSQIQVTVSKPGDVSLASVLGISSPTITATAVAQAVSSAGTNGFIYAASTACNAVSLVSSGKIYTTSIWSNGGFTVNGNSNSVQVSGAVDVGNSSCSFPSQLTPPGATNVGNYTGWPTPLPTTAQGNFPSSCSSASIIITDSSWGTANPPGIYCTTGTVAIVNSGGMTLSGYEFVSENTSSTAITLFSSGNLTLSGYCPASCSSGSTPTTLFYATAGGIYVSNSGNMSFTGDLFAPAGQANLSVSGGTSAGFIEASTIALNNSGNTTLTGTGPTASGGGSSVKLTG